jgi:photosystem II stability/assembly factor-like uncharacterized protein
MRTSILRSLLLLVLVALPTVASAQRTDGSPREIENPTKRREHYYHVRSYPFGRIPQNARLEALSTMAANVPSRAEKSGGLMELNPWRLIGPSNVGGRINAIALHPTDGKTLYVGAASGGVWKSTDRGASWRPIMDFENAIWIGAIAIDPVNTDVIYVGTGDPNPSNGDSYPGAGIMKSTDAGATWRPIGLTNVGSISGIVVDPRNPSIVVVGASDNNAGVYRSTDAGATWTRITSQSVANLVMNPANPDQLWIGTWSNGVLRSNDLGMNWNAVNAGFGVNNASMQRMSVAVCAGSPNVLYALAHERIGTTRELSRIYRSDNGGDSWQMVFNSETTGNNFLGNQVQSQGWYNNTLAVKADDPDVVTAGGVTMVRSGDGGGNWSSIGGNVHADHHAFAFDPANPNVVYNGNDGGMYRSEDGGISYTKISNGLAINQFYAIAVDQTVPDLQYGGTQDNGTYSITSSSAQRVAGGDGFYVVVDHTNPSIIYGEYPDGDLWRLDRSSGSLVGIDNGLSGDAQWSAPLVMDPVDPILYHGRTQLFASVDRGDNWTAISPPVKSGQISAIGVSPVDHDVIYVGSNRGSYLVSRDGGENWSDYTLTSGLPNRYIADFAPSLREANVCYAVVGGFFSGHVYKTTDYGVTWTNVSSNLPDIPVNAVSLHPDEENVIFIGTDLGVFVTVDGGASWATYMNGLPRTEVLDMEVHRTTGELRIATYGRGMWEVTLERPIAAPSITSPHGGEVWSIGSAHVIGWAGFDGPVNVEFSSDDGGAWTPVAQGVAGGQMRWNIPNTPTIWARIRVTQASDPSKTATSRTFTIETKRVGGLVNASSKALTPYGLAYDGEFLYTVDFFGYTMLKIDPTTLETVGLVELQADRHTSDSSLFTDLAYHPGRGTIYMHRLATIDGNGGFLYEFSKTGQQLNRWNSPATYPIGLAWMGADNPELPYMLATDRNGTQQLYLIDPESGETIITLDRQRQVNLGPRGATSAGGNQRFFQVITNFAGTTLSEATAELLAVEDQTSTCTIPLASAGGLMNARGIEYDPADENVWVSDFAGNIYKVVTCAGLEEPSSSAPMLPGVSGASLAQNSPNPFRGSTELSFVLPTTVRAQLTVHDANGRQVAVLADGTYDAGTHRVRFAPTDLASGVYRYSLVVNGHVTATKTMVYLR